MTDLKTQLKNVAFGGSWSEGIWRNSEVQSALDTIEYAVQTCTESDVRTPKLIEALDFLASKIEKGPQLKAQFLKAVVFQNQETRKTAAQNVLKQMKSWSSR
jgi:hypothetical protein